MHRLVLSCACTGVIMELWCFSNVPLSQGVAAALSAIEA